jgi:hypothetical protein
MTGSVDIGSISCDCRGTARPLTPCSRIGNSPIHQPDTQLRWQELTLNETTRKSVTYSESDILIGFQLLIIPAVLVHPVLILHISRLHLAFVPVESDIWLGGCIVSLTRVGGEKSLDICLSVCVSFLDIPLGSDIVTSVRAAGTEIR